jgi:hypothetical protein
MSSLERLRARTVDKLSQALTLLQGMPGTAYGRDSAIDTLQTTLLKVGNIDLNGYVRLKKVRANLDAVFSTPVNEAIRAISGDSSLAVPYDLRQILKQQERAQPDINIVNAAGR